LLLLLLLLWAPGRIVSRLSTIVTDTGLHVPAGCSKITASTTALLLLPSIPSNVSIFFPPLLFGHFWLLSLLFRHGWLLRLFGARSLYEKNGDRRRNEVCEGGVVCPRSFLTGGRSLRLS
jgi:hypothetical protein